MTSFLNRALPLFAALFGSAAFSCTNSGSPFASECGVELEIGALVGEKRGEDVCQFVGIPYAEPPTGKLRFRPPRPAKAWSGRIVASNHTPVCPQDRDPLEYYPSEDEQFLNEDCLYLNVWTPAADGASRPVMVFVHGGAFVVGTANGNIYDGVALARRGNVVVVSLNYRLGALGFAELGWLDPDYTGSSNNGLRDIVLALEWIQHHITGFGGDPQQVTVFGESAGAVAVAALLATDEPQRLMRRAVAQSGSGYQVHSLDYAERIARRVLKGVDTVDDLLGASTEAVLTWQRQALERAPSYSGDSYFAPVVDGALLPAPVEARLRSGNAADIELLTGTNLDETRYWGLYDEALLELPLDENLFFPESLAEQRDAIIAHYRSNRPDAGEGELTHALMTDQLFRVPQLALAAAQAPWAPTRVYEFRWHIPVPREEVQLGAMHALELPFIFGNLAPLGDWPGGRALLEQAPDRVRRLAERMMDAWTAFAHSGDPVQDGEEEWPLYVPPIRATWIWDDISSIERAPREDERALWDDFSFQLWSFTP